MVKTKYLVVKEVPPSAAKAVSDFLTTRAAVDFVELTPKLLFLTRWARGVTQTGNWMNTPLSWKLGLDGRGQVIGVRREGGREGRGEAGRGDLQVCERSGSSPCS
jgi:hypothetical protein